MKINHIMALAAVTLALAGSAGAAVTFAQGDLLMGFHVSSGQGVGQTYVVDIGSAASFRDLAPGSSVTLNLGTIGADLATLYGASWNTRSDMSWGIAGTSSNVDTVNGDNAATLYASRTGAGALAWQITSGTNRSSTSTRMQGMEDNFALGSAQAGAPSATIQADTDPKGWRSYMAPGGVTANTPGGIDFGGFSNIEGAANQPLSLFRVTDSTVGSYEGYFTIDNGGNLTFTSVPEASSALIAGAGALLLAARRRRNA